jgi:hypothetical protein
MWSVLKENQSGWGKIEDRPGHYFGNLEVQQFLNLNGRDFMVRWKQLSMDGCLEAFEKKCIAIWSAPDFCGWVKNEAAALQIVPHPWELEEEGRRTPLFHIRQFESRPVSERIESRRSIRRELHLSDRIDFKAILENPQNLF